MADERRIDAALRDVPLPAGLADRLVAEALFDDQALDRLLARVPVPGGLTDRIRTAAFASGSGRGVDLDRAAGILPAAAPTAAAGRRARGWAATLPAVAVSLAAVACLVIVALESSRRIDRGPGRAAVVLAPTDPPPPSGPNDVPVGMLVVDDAPDFSPLGPQPAVRGPLDPGPDDLVVAAPDDRFIDRPTPPTVRGAAVGAAAGLPATDGGMRTVGAPRSEARRPVPRVAGFDLAFEMAHGEAPFIDPRAAGLAVDHPPLAVATDSVDALVHARNRKGRGGPAGSLRTEEILAALPAAARPRSDGPHLAVQAVRSLRVRPESCLVELSVAAPPLARGPDDRVDAVLALDRYGGSEPLVWQRMCRAVEAVADQMRDGDRVTLVVGGRRPRVAGSRLDGAGLRRVAATLAAEPAEGSADFDATMRAAVAETAGGARRLVVVANVESVDGARSEGRAAVSVWRESLVQSGPTADRGAVGFVLVDPAEPAARAPAEPGFGRTPIDAREMARAVVARVFDAGTVSLRQVRLDVAFDPNVVAAYRLVGHRQSAMESLSPAPAAAIDLHAGETARVVYELVPRAKDGTALRATLTCRPVGAAGEQVFTVALPLQAVEQAPLPSPHGCELLLAVALGELASESPHAGPRGPAVDAVAALATAWRARGDVTAAGAAVLDACAAVGILKPPKPAPPPRR